MASRHSILVVSNREPYLHRRDADGRITWMHTPGGVSVALDALMRERGGVWIAHGAGDADRDVVDEHDRVAVPPDRPEYTLHRIWLTPLEEQRYYKGFSNEGLWPLCHVAHIRPVFRTEDWDTYREVNRRFAEAAAAESREGGVVFINDYHMALVAESLKARRPGVRTAIFWHIPWPHPDRLRICPWRRELLSGLLANDLVAFQLDRDRRNFLTCCRDEFQARVKQGRVHIDGRATRVVTAPIGIDFDRINDMAGDRQMPAEMERMRRDLGLTFPLVGVGVDRLDYTKGIPERLAAIDRLLDQRPELARALTFVQVGVPSRPGIDSYADIEREIDEQVSTINAKHHRGRRPDEGPIRYRKIALKARRLVALYRLADFCIVSSLHDGMNLVAKEFVAAREDGDGVLVLSEMAGAAQELRDAVIINPYDIDGFAAKLAEAIDMPKAERRRRMQNMRRVVAGRDVFAWASDILEGLEHDGRRRRRFLPWRRRK